jgi:hypothetical protein
MVNPELKYPGEMIDPNPIELAAPNVHTEKIGEVALSTRNSMTETDDGNIRSFPDASTNSGHRIGIIEKVRVGGYLPHILRDFDHSGNHPERPENASGHDGIAHRLKYPVFTGVKHILLPCPATTHRNRGNNHIGPGDGFATIQGAAQGDRRSLRFDHPFTKQKGDVQVGWINIHQANVPLAALADQIGQESAGKGGTPRSE